MWIFSLLRGAVIVMAAATTTLGCGSNGSDVAVVSAVAVAEHTTSTVLLLQVVRDDRTERCTNNMDWLVFMEPSATSDQVDAVEQTLLSLEGIERISYLDRDAARLEFRDMFADNPDVLARGNSEILPASFRVWSSSNDDPPANLDEIDGVRETFVCLPNGEPAPLRTAPAKCQSWGTAWTTFLHPEASASETEAVRKRLEEIEGLDHIEYVDQQGAYEEFKQLFADDPQLVAGASPAALPASFRVWSSVGAKPPDDLQAFPGVREIISCR